MPAAPPSPNPPADLAERLAAHRWYHRIQAAPGVWTPGQPGFEALHPPVFRVLDRVDFNGQSVLDIGCRDGLFSLEAERRGAAAVTGIDTCVSRGAVEVLLPHLGSAVTLREGSVYDLDPARHGRFGVVLLLGVLYHLRFAFWGLARAASVLTDDGVLVLETAILGGDEDRALLLCPTGAESPYEPTSCTFFNAKGLVDTLHSLGLAVEHREDLGEPPAPGEIGRSTWLCRRHAALEATHPHAYWRGEAHGNWHAPG